MSITDSCRLKVKTLFSRFGRERILIGLAVFFAVVLSLWIGHNDTTDSKMSDELGVSVPKGLLIVPLELANSPSLAGLITRNGILDLFRSGQKEPVVENLRVLKLSAGEGPLFGALVPEKTAGQLQETFSGSKLRGALKSQNVGPTQFHLHSSTKTQITEIAIGD